MGTRSWNCWNEVMPPKPWWRPNSVSALVSRIWPSRRSWAWTGVRQSALKCRSDRGAFTHSTSRPTRDIGRPFHALYDHCLVDRPPLQHRLIDPDPQPGPWWASRRTTAVAELDQRCGGVLPEQMPAEAALGIPDPGPQRGEGRQQRQLRRRQQRRLPDLAADLEHEPGLQRLPAPRVRADEAAALGDTDVGPGAGPMADERLQRLTVAQALIDNDPRRRLPHQPGQTSKVAGGDRLLERPDPHRAQLLDHLQCLVDVPGHVGVDSKVDPAAEQPSRRPRGLQRAVLPQLELDLTKAEGAHLDQ